MENLNGFLNMMQSVDAFFPNGAFTLSNGLETYVQQEKITDCCQLQKYIEAYMQTFPNNDLGLMYHAYMHAGEEPVIVNLDQLGSAMKSAAEIRTGSNKMCIRFLKAEEKMPEESSAQMKRQTDNKKNLMKYRQLIKSGQAYGQYSIALGIYASDLLMNLDMALSMYSYSVLSAIVNNAAKLVPLSQMDGQKILHASILYIPLAVQNVKKTDINMLGNSGSSYDICCMQHEKLYSRLYMS